jgi:hypothetical protein
VPDYQGPIILFVRVPSQELNSGRYPNKNKEKIMKILDILSQRKVTFLAVGLILTILGLTWLFGDSSANAQSDSTRQLGVVEAATGTGFTYQGLLNQSGMPANGTFTFQFLLYDAATAGTQIGSTQTKTILVSNGLFTTVLNDAGEFGSSAFNGEARYLEIRVSDNGGTSYTTLTPRQSLTAAPYAHSLRPGATISSTLNNASVLNLANNDLDGSGLAVDTAGTGILVNSTSGNGLSVLNAANNGLEVESASLAGLKVGSVFNGVYVSSATNVGFNVDSANTGVNIGSALNGVTVISATTGLDVSSANTGVSVGTATNYGFLVDSAAVGFQVNSATSNGVAVNSASVGLNVANATNGVFVANATTHGLVVGSAANGVYVQSASEDGVHVASATGSGLQVDSAAVGVYVEGPATNWAGFFTGDVNIIGTCTGCLIAMFGVNTGDSPLQPGDMVALQGIRSGESVGQPLLMEVGPAQAGASVVGVVYGRAEQTNMEGLDDQPAAQLAPRAGAAQPGDYVHIVIYGPMQVKASAFDSAIQTGDKLAIDATGSARSLQTRLLDGMRITESAPTIGIALEGLDADKDGLIWVLVNPQ